MATIFKTFGENDTATTRTLLHEAIPLTGTIVSGTYTKPGADGTNIKTYAHGMFDSVFDYPYLSSSANHIIDITMGLSANSEFSTSAGSVTTIGGTLQQDKKINLYNQMAAILVGHDTTGSIKDFTIPGKSGSMRECYFISFSRLLTKDEIKKGSFKLTLGHEHASGSDAAHTQHTINRVAASNPADDKFYTDSPAGEYAILESDVSGSCGLIYYQAGIVVLSASMFFTASQGDYDQDEIGVGMGGVDPNGNQSTVEAIFTGSAISASVDFVRRIWANCEFNNTTELNSTIYFARAGHNEFNYSSNPTYLSSSKVRTKTSTLDQPTSYLTTVGLYSANNELMAVAKLSEPLKKTPENEVTLRVRLDY